MSETRNLPALAGTGHLTTLDDMTLGDVLAKSGYFSDARQAAQAVVKVLMGRELGIGPVTSMVGIHIIQGKPAVGANLIAAKVKGSGRYNYRVRKLDDTGCSIEFFEGGESIGKSDFTPQDAQKAGIRNDMWAKYTRAMCFARAMSQGARWYCPDIFGGSPIYTPEELGASVRINEAGEQEVIDAEVREVTPATHAAIQEAVTEYQPAPCVDCGKKLAATAIKRYAELEEEPRCKACKEKHDAAKPQQGDDSGAWCASCGKALTEDGMCFSPDGDALCVSCHAQLGQE